jgi:OOP family OmpA-OmpF porin
MKKQIIAIAALAAAAAAHADTQNPVYVSVAAGATHAAIECSGAAKCDASDTGGKAAIGYDFGNGFSLEAGYMSFGKFSASDATSSATLKPTAFTLGGAYAFPLGNEWGMNVRLGAAQVKTKGDATVGNQSGSTSETKTKVYAGVGLTYAISPTVKLELGLDSTEGQIAGEKGTLRLISLGATFAF